MTIEDAPHDVEYDFIVVGLGYAGAIMTARLAERNKDAKILAIEYGGPMQALTGGAMGECADMEMAAMQFQNEGMKLGKAENSKYTPEDPLCMVDVPGNYNNVAFRPMAMNGYMLPEFQACWQGIGLGGNGVYNGALYQEPAHWWWDDDGEGKYNDKVHTDIFLTEAEKAKGHKKVSDVMKPYFDLVQKELKDGIRPTPSMDGIHYNHGLYDLVKPILEKNKFKEIDYKKQSDVDMAQLEVTVQAGAGDRFFAVPAVNVKDGLRTGASAWLEKFMTIDGVVNKEKYPNLHVQMWTEVTKVELDETNSVTGVKVKKNVKGAKRGGRTKAPKESLGEFKVKPGGKVVLSCNALPTNRILYLSGVGPELIREQVFPNSTESFKVDNPGIGTTVHEHVTTSLGFKYTGEDKPQPNSIHFDPGDFSGNAEWLAKYSRERSGPYCQFGPVVASHFRADPKRCIGLEEKYNEKQVLDDGEVTTELFYNPFGAGWPYPPVSNRALNPYNGPGTFTVYVMLLRPETRGIFRLKADKEEGKEPMNEAEYVDIYMNDGIPKWETDDLRKTMEEDLLLPDYRALAAKDIATMVSSVHEVLELTTTDEIVVNLGPGDNNTTLTTSLKDESGNEVPVGKLDPTNIHHVKEYCTTWDDWSVINGQRLAMTHLQENHYHSTVPLARNLDVFGKDLGDRKDTYGLNPDNCEVKGTTGLCVVDAGMFPKVVYCHPIGSVMALAEWAADRISPPKE